MDINGIINAIMDGIKKYRYVIFILIMGIVFMSIPIKENKTETTSKPAEIIESKTELQDQLEVFLSQLKGAGRVRVLLTQAKGEEIIYQSDESSTSQDSSGTLRRETVTVTDAQRTQSGLIRQVNPPQYLGAVILCEGGNHSEVQLEIAKAVSSITGLSYDKITVLELK